MDIAISIILIAIKLCIDAHARRKADRYADMVVRKRYKEDDSV